MAQGKAVFNERFAMKTVLNYNSRTEEYEAKPVSIEYHHHLRVVTFGGVLR